MKASKMKIFAAAILLFITFLSSLYLICDNNIVITFEGTGRAVTTVYDFDLNTWTSECDNTPNIKCTIKVSDPVAQQ